MRTQQAGRGGLTVTDLSFGAAQIGNLFTAMTDAIGAVDAAWSAGVRYFDTAPRYGGRPVRTPARCCGTTLPAAAAQFPLAHPAVASVCLGMRSREQALRNAALFDTSIPVGLWPR